MIEAPFFFPHLAEGEYGLCAEAPEAMATDSGPGLSEVDDGTWLTVEGRLLRHGSGPKGWAQAGDKRRPLSTSSEDHSSFFEQ